MVFDGGGVALRNMGSYGLGVMGCLESYGSLVVVC